MKLIPKAPNYEAIVRNSFSQQGLMANFSASISNISPGLIELSAPLTPKVSQQQGFGHAGLTFALGDSAAGYAALSLMAEGNEVLTAEMKINLLAPAKGDRVFARGRVVKPGRRLIVVTSEVFCEDNDQIQQIALLQGTMVPVTLG